MGDGDGSGSSSKGRAKLSGISTDIDGDVKMSGSGRGSYGQSSASGSGTRTGSGSVSGSGTASGSGSGNESPGSGSFMTAATSRSSGGSFGAKSASMESARSPSISTTSQALPRMTYVNPSPTVTSTNYPFVSSNYGSGFSASTTFNGTFGRSGSFGSGMELNTNPDPPPYTIVTFGAGTHSKELDAATSQSPYGAFHVPTSAFPVGAGQFLLGGFGFLGRKHGLAMDNIVEAEVVLADGRIVWVGAEGRHGGEWKEGESPSDLWYALRGAGPTLGIVTRFRAKAFYLPSVYAGYFI